MMKNDGGPAFPAIWSHGFTENKYPGGMSLRDYFAAHALSLYSSGTAIEAASIDADSKRLPLAEYVALGAYEFADAMLKAREK